MILVVGTGTFVILFFIRKTDPRNSDESERTNIKTAQEFLPFEDIRDNMIILGNHKYRAVLGCTSTNYQLKTEAEREQMEMAFQRFLNSIIFPITMFLQTKLIDNTKRQQALKEEIEMTLIDFPDMRNYAEQYLQDMEDLNGKIGNSQQKKRYIIVTYDDAGNLGTLSEDEKVTYASKEIRNRCNIISSNLDAVGVGSHILTTAELVELVYSCLYRDDYSYAEAISDRECFDLFVNGTQDRFKEASKVEILDLILGETINKIESSHLESEISGKAALEGLKNLRKEYADYFQELEEDNSNV